MPRIYPASRSTRASRNAETMPLRRYAKPRNMDRLLAALYETFQANGTSWISVDSLLNKIEEQAATLGDTLGKKFGSYCRSCLSSLRRNSYVEYRVFDFSDDQVLITDYMKEIFENLRDTIPTFGDQSGGDLYRLKCDFLRREIQPKSRRLPTRVELDRENIILGQKNRELMEENVELQSELELLKQNQPDLTALPLQEIVQVLRREPTRLTIEQMESRFTNSMYTDPVSTSQEQASVQPRFSMAQLHVPVITTQSLSRQNTIQTPTRQCADAWSTTACYPTPESAPRNTLRRQDSHLCSPPASPGLRRSSPAYSMPGALLIDSSGGENDSEEESQEEDAGTIIDNNFGQIMTRLSTPNPTGFDNHGATTFPTASLALIQTEVPSPNCASCALHQNPVDSTPACQECDSKMKIIESNEEVISELRGDLQDHKTLIGNLQGLILEKIKKIRELTSNS